MSSPVFPEPPRSVPETSIEDCDAAVDAVHAVREQWVATAIPDRIELLKQAMDDLMEVAPEWVEAARRAKGHDAGSSGVGEEWLGGPMTTMRNLRLLVHALEYGGQPALPGKTLRADGQWVCKVFPTELKDSLLFTGFSAEVWIEPGKEPSQGRIYREKAQGTKGEGGVALVLGAGNQSSIPPMDLLYKLYVDDEVVVLKMNPVNEYIGPYLERAFRAYIAKDLLRIVYGGAAVGKHLCDHDKVDTIHITGSERTHDAIVWGTTEPEELARRKSAGERANEKPITSELGAVTPCLVVPGPWSDKEIDYQARHVAAMVAHNGSFNCNALKALVVAKGWDKKDQFLAAVERHLSATRPRKSYYPGAQDRYDGFIEHYPNAKALGDRGDAHVPWTIIPDVKPDASEYALSVEAFCGVMAITELDASDAAGFLEKAVPFCNDVMWGTLSCMMLVHGDTQKQHGAAVDDAIARLRYGGIGVNVWAGVVYGLVVTTWGAFPGHPLEDIQSGRGVVHNTFLLDHPQKSVIRAPFVIKPTPAWFADHKNLEQLGERLTRFEHTPSWLNVPGVALAGLKG